MISPSRTLAAIAVILGCSNCATPTEPAPFSTDGCSRFPDGSLSQRKLWQECCYEHDKAYWRGGTFTQRRAADRELRECVDEVRNPALALMMYEGVRAGGSPWFPTRYRWAYGWPYGRGYRELSQEEQRTTDEVLEATAADDPRVGTTEPD